MAKIGLHFIEKFAWKDSEPVVMTILVLSRWGFFLICDDHNLAMSKNVVIDRPVPKEWGKNPHLALFSRRFLSN